MNSKPRAWLIAEERMVEVICINFYFEYIEHLIGDQVHVVSFNRVILMQSTGLFDKNGVEIFDKDILKHPNNPNLFIVTWDEHAAGYYLSYKFGDCILCAEVESGAIVIGNELANPEMLEVKS